MKILILFFYCLTAYAQLFTFRHEEDLNTNCDLQNVTYPSIDVTGRAYPGLSKLNFIYNDHGKYLGVIVDKNSKECEPQGFILSSSETELDLIEALRTNFKRKKFSFNDAYQDAKDTPPDNLVLGLERKIPIILEVSGVNSRENHGLRARYRYAAEQATAAMDYRMHLPGFDSFIVLDGVLYNAFDAGNYLWGAGMRRLGFSYLEVKVGSELNGAFRTRSQNQQGRGIILAGDSVKDQRAIKAGFNSEHAKINFQDYIRQLRIAIQKNESDFQMLKNFFLDKIELQSDVETLLTLIKSPLVKQRDLNELSDGLAFRRWFKYSNWQRVKILEAVIQSPVVTKSLLETCYELVLKSNLDAVTATNLQQLIQQKLL